MEASRNIVLDIAKEGSYCGKTSVPGGNAVLPAVLYMIQKRQNQVGIEILNLKINRPTSSMLSSEPHQYRETVGVGGDRVGARAAMPWQMIHEIGGEMGSERGHWRSEEHTSELQSLMRISYAVFC